MHDLILLVQHPKSLICNRYVCQGTALAAALVDQLMADVDSLSMNSILPGSLRKFPSIISSNFKWRLVLPSFFFKRSLFYYLQHLKTFISTLFGDFS